jgi:hypothetical protein
MMGDRAIDVYLNDHLAGATLGSDLAEQIRARHEGDPLGAVMAPLAHEIEEDRERLVDLMERMDVKRNPIKQATGWLAEKTSRVKFSGIGSGEPDQSAFMALESLALGVEGKASLWRALTEIQSQYPALIATDLLELIARADRQHELLERERLAVGARALANRESVR